MTTKLAIGAAGLIPALLLAWWMPRMEHHYRPGPMELVRPGVIRHENGRRAIYAVTGLAGGVVAGAVSFFESPVVLVVFVVAAGAVAAEWLLLYSRSK